jgi:hypothetical protein
MFLTDRQSPCADFDAPFAATRYRDRLLDAMAYSVPAMFRLHSSTSYRFNLLFLLHLRRPHAPEPPKMGALRQIPCPQADRPARVCPHQCNLLAPSCGTGVGRPDCDGLALKPPLGQPEGAMPLSPSRNRRHQLRTPPLKPFMPTDAQDLLLSGPPIGRRHG